MIEKKILVVDDEEGIRDILTQSFQKAGFAVRAGESAERAVEILQQESIMVMFMDLNLPGMSGVELCQKLKKENPVGIYFAVTGYADFFGLLECRKAGFDDFFTKPVQLKILLEAAEYAFRKLERWQVDEYELV